MLQFLVFLNHSGSAFVLIAARGVFSELCYSSKGKTFFYSFFGADALLTRGQNSVFPYVPRPREVSGCGSEALIEGQRLLLRVLGSD